MSPADDKPNDKPKPRRTWGEAGLKYGKTKYGETTDEKTPDEGETKTTEN